MGGGKGSNGDDDAERPRRDRRATSESEFPLFLAEEDEGRVTMDFTGPPLDLPDDEELSGELHARQIDSAEEPLSLELSDIEGDEGDEARNLVARRGRTSSMDIDLGAEMRERFALDDFSGALRVAELILGRDSAHVEALHVADESRRRLEQLYMSRLGGTAGVAQVVVRRNDVRWLGLDHRAGFLLSRVDGLHTIDDLLDVSGMPRIETLKTLVDLLDSGAIRIT